MKDINDLLGDKVKAAVNEHLNGQKMLMHRRTGVIQSQELWQQEAEEQPDACCDDELVEVKLLNNA